MTNGKATSILKKIQRIDFKGWHTNLWLVKRHLSGREAVYSVVRVETDSKLNRRLKGAITSRLQGKDMVLEEYTFLSSDQDNRIFTLDSSETDFVKIEEEIKKGIDNPRAIKYEQLLNSWALVIELRKDDEAIYGMRKINALTQAKKVNSLTSLFFRDDMLVDLSDEQVFTLDLNLDFLVSDGFAFITHKKDFESALNFRKGMEDNRDATLDEFDMLGVFSDIIPLREHIGDNLNHLRKVSTIRKSAYYQDRKFMESLIKVLAEQDWGVVVVDGKITVTADNAETVLTLLSNSRLISMINREIFDAAVKKKVI